jgi:diguanylate cyclase (GGDEF)-like protein
MWQRSLHVKLTGAMILVLVLDGAGYLLAVSHVEAGQEELLVILSDIFVVVAMLTVSVGLVLPGMIAHAAGEVATAADRLARGTLSDLTRAMQALGASRLDDAHARVEDTRVDIRSKDEIGAMAGSFNRMQDEAHRAAQALDVAREGLRTTEDRLQRTIEQQAAIAHLGQIALESGDGDDVLDQLVQDAARLVRVDLAVLVEAENGAVWVRSSAGPRSGELERLQHVAGPLSAQEVIREDRFGEVDPLRAAWGRAGVSLPVPGGDGVAMSLCCVRATSGGFDEEELDYLRAAVNILAEARSRRRSEQEMLYQALHDPLTGLPNRALFLDRLRHSLASSGRRGTTTGVMFLDLDQFKLVNDSLGHAAGDDLLRQVARRLGHSVRPGDTVARFGGDEFLVIADALDDVAQAKEIAGRLVLALLEPFRLQDGQDLVVRSSIGIAASTGAVALAEDLIREADAAMYRAKERGRDRIEVYDEVMRSSATTRLTLGNALSHAVERDELVLHYQPIVDLRDGRITGLEALLRWMHPVRGLVPPGEFIPLAEATGLIVEMGAWVLEEACRQAAAWRATMPAGRAPSISVNLSLRQVTQPGVVDVVAHALEASGLPPEALHLEVTESVLMEEGDVTIATLDALKALGIVLVLDDFGTGYSSLAYVRRFPIDVLKIDRSFIADLDAGGPDAFPIVDAIIHMADGLRLGVIAEGIERPEQVEVLRELGCHTGQGFYFARPRPGSDVLRLLEAGSALPAVVA